MITYRLKLTIVSDFDRALAFHSSISILLSRDSNNNDANRPIFGNTKFYSKISITDIDTYIYMYITLILLNNGYQKLSGFLEIIY